MKQFLYASLMFSACLQADEPFIITNLNANQEIIEKLTTTDGEYETLFEIVDLNDTPPLSQTEELLLPEVADEPLLSLEPEKEEATPSVIAQPTIVQNEPIAIATPAAAPSVMREPVPGIKINFNQVFSGSPTIYSLLLSLSILALFIGLYTQIHLNNLAKMSETVTKSLRHRLTCNQYDEALAICTENDNLFCKMLASGISVRRYGLQIMSDTMKAEGKRATVKFWQKLSLLNDIAIIAPMLGLLGTVLGMFYAFYDVNRSLASVSALFDGLGISVGTTLAGLMVALFALMLHSAARYRLVKRLAYIENEVQTFVTIIDNKI